MTYFNRLINRLGGTSENTDVIPLSRAAQSGAFNRAYHKRIKEIESLRLYDRGEKDITSHSLRHPV